MELEFELRQQRQQKQEPAKAARVAPAARASGGQQAARVRQKLVTFDENNNNNNNNNDNEKQQKVVQYSDDDWRGLSPNAETNQLGAGQAAAKLVPAELVCDKLHQHQASADAAKTTRRTGDERATLVLVQTPPTESNSSAKQTADNFGRQASDNCGSNGRQVDELQLISIDPTLCHSGSESSAARCSDQMDGYGNGADEQRESDEAMESTVTIEPEPGAYNEREEQMMNEEFSSSSSSFGPMSISMPQQEDELARRLRLEYGADGDEDDEEEDDEPSSTQNGSVLTVITKLNSHNETSQLVADEKLDPAARESDTRAAKPTQEPSSQLDESGTAVEREPLAAEEEDDEGGSNIGVAFESLQFDSEIKSSKQEKIEDEAMFLAPQPLSATKRPPPPPPPPTSTPATATKNTSKFNAKEVKSVCSFITAAISDATRQVESFMHPREKEQREEEGEAKQGEGLARFEGDNRRVSKIGHSGEQGTNLEGQQVSVDGSIQRATFVQESSCGQESYLNGDSSSFRSVDEQQTFSEEGSMAELEFEAPKADLSSIFETNVRREIQRFETNSITSKKSPGSSSIGGSNGSSSTGSSGKSLTKGGLTEWRIAEEIRQFNERELELKKRFGDHCKQNKATVSNSTGSNEQQSEQSKSSTTNQDIEAIVRFGKTLKLPKPASSIANTQSNLADSHQSRCIKLTSVANSPSNGSSQQTTTISMHKFISSSGKRFVFTTSPSATGGNSTLQGHQFTKSMSNLSTLGARNSPSEVQRTVDYKAVDSLMCKETPNVKPGITRKVIETFARMSHIPRGEAQRVGGASHCRPNTSNNFNGVSNNGINNVAVKSPPTKQPAGATTAELKIQEELREMRAREAELRDQRRRNSGKNPDSCASPQDDEGLALRDRNQADASNLNESFQPYHDAQQQQQHQTHSNDRLSLSSESLYPIKQAIDSFRRLNLSSGREQNNLVPSTQRTIVPKFQRKLAQVAIQPEEQQAQDNNNTEDHVSDSGYRNSSGCDNCTSVKLAL